MYAYISGKLTEKNPAYAVVDVHGVGYLVSISLNTFTQIKDLEHGKLFTYLVVKEDALQLFGFSEVQERQLFIELISVSGVGPNTARMILSSLTPDEVISAISTANASMLQKVKGIGGKTAQRIIVDLKDKFSRDGNLRDILPSAHNTLREEALSGLMVLGFSRNQVEKALQRVMDDKGAPLSVEEMIREALRIL
ncbi:MAG: Holliday junction branch migration protein RuvA [Bacteroidetes bacterium]|nr:Holliday junction branch migration protein RuvA [Bacteroidota bacterium]